MAPGSLPTRRGLTLLCTGLTLLALVPASAQETAAAKPAGKLTAFVAASTTEVMGKLAQAFEKETGVAVEVVPGPSSGLAKQIDQGAGADLFLSADQANVDYLEKKGLIVKRRVLLHNRLVVVTPADSTLKLANLAALAGPEIKRLALTEAKVPAGEYSRQALTKAEILEKLGDRIVGGVDVRATLQFVARGEAEAGIVYYTDTIGNSKVRIALEIDPASHQPIEYPVALVKRDRAHPQAVQLYDFLATEQAAEAFRAAKFVVPTKK